jgi:cytidylate kinase
MALIAVTGEPGCRYEETARIAAVRLGYELVTELRLASLIEEQFGDNLTYPPRVYADLSASVLARLSTEHHLVVSAENADMISRPIDRPLRVRLVAPDNVRTGNIMLEHRLDRDAARKQLRQLESDRRRLRRERFRSAPLQPDRFDLVLNTETMDSDQMVEVITSAVRALCLEERGLFSGIAEAQVQFDLRLRLAKFGILPVGIAGPARKPFVHPSEQVFANLLDFYRIAWEYEPRSFAIRWDEDGKPCEAFTPDFYLPEFDLYIELTTMKQSLVTRKNRKIRLLREHYPNVNIQVFYQKDFENLIFKYGLVGEAR